MQDINYFYNTSCLTVHDTPSAECGSSGLRFDTT